MKEIDLTRSLYEITEKYPELIDILKELGFLGLANPVMRNTVGRITTLTQGCKKMGKDCAEVITVLKNKGFDIRE